LAKSLPFEKKWEKIRWDTPSPKYLIPFENGKTGFPIIDAGIRQMLTTGFMHNRVRMLVASFFSKDLLYDWRIGEKFFAINLYDYDPTQNNSGWQTVAGTGASALEWFRVMNPWTQTDTGTDGCSSRKDFKMGNRLG
jgi:deoxyribodipyrimidine photo-lyase